MSVDVSVLCVHPADSIRQAALCIDKGSRGIALVIDDNRHLLDNSSALSDDNERQ